MSRVADALRLAHLETPAAETFTTDDHPWVDDLGTEDDSRTNWRSASEIATPSAVDDGPPRAVRLHAAESDRELEIVQAQSRSPLADLPSSIRHQITGVVDRVFLQAAGDAPRCVAFAGVDADARSGWVAAAVADVLAQRTAARVAIADMNVALPQVDDYFGIRSDPGSIASLGSGTSASRGARQVRTNLWSIATEAQGGQPPADSRTRISRLTATYDHVILSLEPLAGWCGGGSPTMSDGIVLVIAADGTRRQAGRQIAKRLQDSGITIFGAVLTNRRYAIPEAIYKRL